MKDETVETAANVVALELLIAFFIFFGFFIGQSTEKNDAIAARAAHYTVNPQTGETKFEYITPKEKTP